MNLDDVPVVNYVLESGPDDPVFDTLLLSGPLVIGILALVGREPVSVGLGVLYLLVFAGYLPYKWLSGRDQDR
ncbi:hypothetical protein [Haloarchaeobius iranensis]|uniref:Uncharacterized protein n=1 Tax=Haloarchaeobius iranensis TaxID=996166 RepID=A0A1H0A7H9_9EURY|nr:hypothetical protein [Haloarchaeobius iranensis]SDN29154.1 hypothetical protein SAMN05192554_12519 [Haloarchaeobius iranensis]